MLWCLIPSIASSLIIGLFFLLAPMPRPSDLRNINPKRLLRGCLAGSFLLISLLLGLLTLALARPDLLGAR